MRQWSRLLPGVVFGGGAVAREDGVELLEGLFVEVISSERSEPSNCSIVRGPMIGAVTAGG